MKHFAQKKTIHLIVLLLVFISQISSILATTSCSSNCSERYETFNPSANTGMGVFTNMCSNLVDYSFYIPENITQEYLNLVANLLGSGYDGALSTDCLVSIKRDICSKIFLAHSPSSNLSDPLTWNYAPVMEGGSAPLPFNRPCRSNCQRVVDDCGTAGVYLDAIPDCDAESEDTGASVYSTNETECETSLSSLSTYVSVAAPVEYLIFQTACGEMVDEVYTGIHDPLNLAVPFGVGDIYEQPKLSLAPLLPPYYNQLLTETVIDIVWELPVLTPFSRSRDCVEADRMFMCSTAFSQPKLQPQLQSYLPDFYIPLRSSYRTCQYFIDTCQSYSYNLISVASYEMGLGAFQTVWDAFEHCSVKNDATGFSAYPKQPETLNLITLGNETLNITLDPYHIRHPLTKSFVPDNISVCKHYFGTYYPMVEFDEIPNIFDPWADPVGMPMRWYEGLFTHSKLNNKKMKFNPWKYRICRQWSELNPPSVSPRSTADDDDDVVDDDVVDVTTCPYSYHHHHNASLCFKSCYHWGNSINSSRNKKQDKIINYYDKIVLSIVLFMLLYMITTLYVFKEYKSKSITLLILSILLLLSTLIELYGYIFYSDFKRFCENKAVPKHHGLNYCALSAMINLGLIQPLVLFYIFFYALETDVTYVSCNINYYGIYKFIRDKSNKNDIWKYYLLISLIGSISFKFIPVFIYGEAAGFDGVNACGYSFQILRPLASSSPTPVELINEKLKLTLLSLILYNALDHILAFLILCLFFRITYRLIFYKLDYENNNNNNNNIVPMPLPDYFNNDNEIQNNTLAMKQLSTVHPNIHPHIHPNVGHPHIGQIASPVPRPIINIGKSQGVMLPGQSQGPIGAPATTIRDEQQGVSFVSLEPKGKEGKEKEERHEVVIAAPDVSRSTSIEEANSESIKKEKKIERKRAKKMKLMRELDNTTQKDIKKKKKRVNNIEEVNLSIYSIIKAWTNILTAPLTLSIFVILFSMIQIYFWDAYAIKNWAIFTGDKPTTKTYGELEELSLWFQTQSMNYIVNGTLNTVSLRIHDLDNFYLLDLMYYRKIIGHGFFPILLFVTFGFTFDNLSLWHYWINANILNEGTEKTPKPPKIAPMGGNNEIGHAHQQLKKLYSLNRESRERRIEESFRVHPLNNPIEEEEEEEEEGETDEEEEKIRRLMSSFDSEMFSCFSSSSSSSEETTTSSTALSNKEEIDTISDLTEFSSDPTPYQQQQQKISSNLSTKSNSSLQKEEEEEEKGQEVQEGEGEEEVASLLDDPQQQSTQYWNRPFFSRRSYKISPISTIRQPSNENSSLNQQGNPQSGERRPIQLKLLPKAP